MKQLAMASDYCGYTDNREEIQLTLRKIKEAGFTHVHWCHDWDGPRMYTEDEINYIGDILTKFGLRLKGIHATDGRYYHGKEGMFKELSQYAEQPCYFSFDETRRQQGEDLLRNRIELAIKTGTRDLVLHMQLPYVQLREENRKEEFFAQAYKSLDAVKSLANAYGVRICFENLPGTPNEEQFDQFDRLFDRYDADFVGYCCDTGHSFLTDAKDPFCFARKYKDRMFMMHLNDNHGYPVPGDFSNDRLMAQSDEHHVMGDGIVDFRAFAEITADSAYEDPVIGEFVLHGETDTDFLEKCRIRMEQFARQVETFRTAKKTANNM